MAQNPPPSDPEVAGWLHTLGVVSLCQWDVLVFLYRHQTTLLGAADLARLLGYASDPIVVALDVLESLGLVERSRVSQGARLYQFIVPLDLPARRGLCTAPGPGRPPRRPGPRRPAVAAGPHPRGDAPAGPALPRRGPAAPPGVRRQAQQREERRQPWLKAI